MVHEQPKIPSALRHKRTGSKTAPKRRSRAGVEEEADAAVAAASISLAGAEALPSRKLIAY